MNRRMRTRRSRRNRRRTNRRGGKWSLSNFGTNTYYAAMSAAKRIGLKPTRTDEYKKDIAQAEKIEQLKRDLSAGKNDHDFKMFKITNNLENNNNLALSRYMVHLKLTGKI